MPTDTLTAQQLWDQTDNYRREGGPEMPKMLYFDWNRFGAKKVKYWQSGEFRVELDHAAAILRDHGRTWLETEGWTVSTTDTFKLVPDRDDREHLWDVRYQLEITLQDVSEETTTHKVECASMLECYNSAIGAVLDAKEGK